MWVHASAVAIARRKPASQRSTHVINARQGVQNWGIRLVQRGFPTRHGQGGCPCRQTAIATKLTHRQHRQESGRTAAAAGRRTCRRLFWSIFVFLARLVCGIPLLGSDFPIQRECWAVQLGSPFGGAWALTALHAPCNQEIDMSAAGERALLVCGKCSWL
jgi:hypothetical protein